MRRLLTVNAERTWLIKTYGEPWQPWQAWQPSASRFLADYFDSGTSGATQTSALNGAVLHFVLDTAAEQAHKYVSLRRALRNKTLDGHNPLVYGCAAFGLENELGRGTRTEPAALARVEREMDQAIFGKHKFDEVVREKVRCHRARLGAGRKLMQRAICGENPVVLLPGES
jgi:hypothetical protein